MKEGFNKTTAPKRRSITPIKEKQLDVLESFRDQLRLLIQLQGSLVSKGQHSGSPSYFDEQRLRIYDATMPVLTTIFEKMEKVLLTKHPGGAPKNPYRDLAFDLLTTHYIDDGKVLKPKALVKLVLYQLPESKRHADAYGNEPFSVRIAREVISNFKVCLHYPIDDWN
jgi:hypothetical protein